MSQPISFHKMQALGNDFVVINTLNQSILLEQQLIQHLANRHMGIGCDQLLLLESSSRADFGCRIFNADGSEAEQCGNGVRCLARFVHERQLIKSNSISLETKAGILDIVIKNYDSIQVNMGKPIFEPANIPFIIEKSFNIYELMDIRPDQLTVLSMGNPHAIIQVPSLRDYPVAEIGAKMTAHPAFPASTNSGFIEIIDRQHIHLRTFERGSGETFACGSNACAAVVAGIKNGWLDPIVKVELIYGQLLVEWQSDEHPVLMTGPAASVFTGMITI
jgi:diaminopimelate epimerase